VLQLTTGEQGYLAASTARRDREQAAEAARRREEARLRRRSGRRLWSSVAAIAGVVLVVAVAYASRPAGTARVGLIHGSAESGFDRLFEEGMDQLERRFDVVSERVVPLTDPGDALRNLCAAGFDLVFVGGFLLVGETLPVAPACPDTMLVMLDAVGLEELELPPNVLPVTFATDEGSFLAGAAAALETSSGVVGFVGGQPVALVEEFRAGFEAGAARAAPDVVVLATYVTHRASGDAFHEAFGNRPGGALAARRLYEQDADVVYAVAGESGRGVLDAAMELSDPEARRWVVGVDTDWHLTESTDRARHVLTSMVKRFDVAMDDVVQAFVDDELTSEPRRFGLGSGGVELSSRGGRLADPAALALLRQQLIDGEITVPTTPSGPTLPAPTDAPR
jgi:basic membrane protein A and related proteins